MVDTQQDQPPLKKIKVEQSGGQSQGALSDLFKDVFVVSEEPPKFTPTEMAQKEVEQYRGMPSISLQDDPLKWWKENSFRFPKLSVLAKHYLCIPASSVPSERVFSKAGELVNDRRASLKPNIVDKLIFLNKNMKRK